MRQEYAPNAGLPRVYPPDIVERIRTLYAGGWTVAEIQKVMVGYKVQTIMTRYRIERRRAIKRNQSGSASSSWRGDALGYQAAHVRVATARGPASAHACVDCGMPATDWAYNHTDPSELRRPNGTCPYSPNPDHYSPRCRKCHRALDRANRKEVMPHVS